MEIKGVSVYEDIPRQYRREAVSRKYIELLDKVLVSVLGSDIPRQSSLVGRDANDKSLTDVFYFNKYIISVPLGKTTKDQYNKALETFARISRTDRININTKGFKSVEEAERVFCYSAYASGQHIEARLAGYISFCRRYDYEPFGVVKHEDAADHLLAKYSGTSFEESFHQLDKMVISKAEKSIQERAKVQGLITDFISSPDHSSGYIQVVGGAGVGKSSVLAKYIVSHFNEDNSFIAWYFLQLGSGKNTVRFFSDSIFAQLSKHYELSQFINSEGKLTSQLNDILEYISKNYLAESDQKLVLVVDALDELDKTDPTYAANHINKLGLPKEVPENIYILVSSRSFDGQVYIGDSQVIDIGDHTEIQHNDIQSYLKSMYENDTVHAWAQRQEWDGNKNLDIEKEFISLLIDKCGHTFIYLYYVFSNIDSYSIDDLPDGLDAYYKEQYNRLISKSDQYAFNKRKILASLVTYPPDLSLPSIAHFSDLVDREIDDISRDWHLTRLISKNRVDGILYLSLFHTSFREFLSSTHDVLDEGKDRHNLIRLAKYIDDLLEYDDCAFYISDEVSEKECSEIFRIILPLYKSASGRYLSKLSVLISNPMFCKQLIASNKLVGVHRVLECVSYVFSKLQGKPNGDVSSFEFLKNFYLRVTPRNDSSVITSDDASQAFQHVRSLSNDSISHIYGKIRFQDIRGKL